MKVLITLLGRIGDMILATPIFEELEKRYPGVEIYVLASRLNYSVIENNPHIKRIYVYDKSPIKLAMIIFGLRRYEFDFYIDAKDHKSNEGTLLARLIKSKVKIGYNQKGEDTFEISYPELIDTSSLHFSQLSLAAISAMGYQFDNNYLPKPALYSNSTNDKVLNDFLNSKGIVKYGVLNIAASSPDKTFSYEALKSIAAEVDFPFPILINASGEYIEKAKSLTNFNKQLIYYPTESIKDAISCVKQADFVISPDTSIVHISAAFDKDLFTLYSGREDFYTKFYPLNTNATILRADAGDYGIQSIDKKLIIKRLEEFLTQVARK